MSEDFWTFYRNLKLLKIEDSVRRLPSKKAYKKSRQSFFSHSFQLVKSFKNSRGDGGYFAILFLLCIPPPDRDSS